MKNQRWFLAGLIFAVMTVTWGMDQGAHAQSQPDVAAPSEKGGQAAPSDKSAEASFLKTQKDQVNYAIGVNVVGNIKKQGVDIDLNMVMKGMQDAFSGEKLLMSDAELSRALKLYYVEVRQMRAKTMATTAAENRKEGEAFLAENGKKAGVVTLPSGLQYRIIQAAQGKKPTSADTVEVHYRGTLINGSEFESSDPAGTPMTLKVKDAIPGWQEALKRMPVGSTWQIFVPSQLAYGEQGRNGPIGPNATLVFELKLLSIKGMTKGGH